MMTDERTVAAFELRDLGVDRAQYFQGAGTAFTDWDEVFVGVGDTAREAAFDALEAVASYPNALFAEMATEADTFDNERSAHDDCTCDCPPNDLNECLGDCDDECELQHYAALYVRYAESDDICFTCERTTDDCQDPACNVHCRCDDCNCSACEARLLRADDTK